MDGHTRGPLCGEPGEPARTLHACSACAGDYEDPERTARARLTESRGEQDAYGGELAAEHITSREGGDVDAEKQSKDDAK